MESSGSSATPPRAAVQPSHPITDRILRAIRHRLLLLHRAGSTFFVLGATGNVYTISLSSAPSCSCPDRTKPCKHILFVLIKALGVPPEAPCLRRRTLRPCVVERLLAAPTLGDSLAESSLQDRFREMFQQHQQWKGNGSTGSTSNVIVEAGEGATCPVCLEEMEGGEKAESCKTCRNWIHEECWLRWKRSKGKRYANCVVCRAKWVSKEAEDKYLNLAAYASAATSAASSASDQPTTTNNGPCQ